MMQDNTLSSPEARLAGNENCGASVMEVVTKQENNENSNQPREKVTFGWELIIDLYDCDQKRISTAEDIQNYARQLCDVIEMKAYGEPQTPYFGENNEHTKGYSLLQFIETSSITGHFSEGTGAAYINIFSCKPYSVEKAEAFTQEYFGAKRINSRFLVRD
ncbi:MAG: S-adenosylmethionine decarboxylase [Candidatus Sumerlaeota bacterium]